MNATAYNKGQSTRVAINNGASTVANTARDASISVLSFLKGVLASPHAVPSTKAKPRAKAKTAAKAKPTAKAEPWTTCSTKKVTK